MAKKKAPKKSIRDKFNAAYSKMKNEKARCDCGGKGCSSCDCGR